MNKYRCRDGVRRDCDVKDCDGIYYGEDCECAKVNEKVGEQPTATNFQRITASPEKLAEFLEKLLDSCHECGDCPAAGRCFKDNRGCKENFTDWLNNPEEN